MNDTKALYATVVFFLGFVCIFIGNKYGLDKTTWPAWVQAFGSIATFIGAIYIMNRQGQLNAELAKKLRFEEMGRRLEVIEALIEGAYEVARVMETHTQPLGNFWDYMFSVLDPQKGRSAVNSLKAIPLHTMDSYNLVISISDMIDALEKLEPLIVFHSAQNNVHYVFEDEQKKPSEIFLQISEASARAN